MPFTYVQASSRTCSWQVVRNAYENKAKHGIWNTCALECPSRPRTHCMQIAGRRSLFVLAQDSTFMASPYWSNFTLSLYYKILYFILFCFDVLQDKLYKIKWSVGTWLMLCLDVSDYALGHPQGSKQLKIWEDVYRAWGLYSWVFLSRKFASVSEISRLTNSVFKTEINLYLYYLCYLQINCKTNRKNCQKQT